MPYTEKEIRQILKIRCEEEDVEMSEVRYGEIWGDMGRYGEIWGVCVLQAVHPLGAPPHPRPFLATSSTRPRHFLDTPQVVHHTDVIPRASLRNLLLLSSLEAERRILVTPVLPVVVSPRSSRGAVSPP